MKDREFNLLEEPWVRVMRPDCAVAEVSLAEALLNAHEYVDLAGEMPTQDAAVLRVLLALLFAVFTRVDAEGREAPFVRPKDAIARWHEIWTLGRFPEKPLRDYFARWHDRFWLFDPDHPFFQVPDKAWKRVKKEGKKKGAESIEEAGTAGTVAKLNGELLESDNKLRLFKTVGMDNLTYAQATRWLISLMAWDDTAAKPTKDKDSGKKYPSPGVGWLGYLGYIQAQGKTLFETLMLNLTLLKDGQVAWEWMPASSFLSSADKPWCYLPSWELEEPRDGERSPLFLPNHQDGEIIEGNPDHNKEALKRQDRKPCNPMALFAIQSRRIRLSRQNDRVSGYLLLGGDFFDKENAFVEQMTLWRNANAGKKNLPPSFVPRQHDASKQFWREFPTAFVPSGSEGTHLPGVVRWIATLRQQGGGLGEETMVRFAVRAMGYGDKYFFVNDSFSDGLSFHAALLDEKEENQEGANSGVRERIVAEIELCEKAAGAVGWLARDLATAAGGETDGAAARDQFYFRVDRPFRQWLEALDPAGDVDAAIDAWRDTARNIALTLGDELARAAGPTAFVGRMGKKGHLSTPEALRLFKGTIRKIYMKGA